MEESGDGWLWLSLAAIVVLVLLSGFFSGSETALTAVSRSRMHHMARQGNERARIVRRLAEQQESLIGAILLGNNLVNILSASIATSVLITLFGDAGVAYATLGMTLLILIFAEVLPKTFAINHTDRAALAVAPLMKVYIRVMRPAVITIQWIVRGCLRLMGEDARPVHSVEAHEEELRGAIELHRGEDSEIRDERRMLRSVLELGDVEVSEVMTHRSSVVMVDAELPAAEIVEQVLVSPYTRIPIFRGDHDDIAGVLHAKQLLRAVNMQGEDLDRLDVTSLAATAWFIPDTTVLLDQLHAFRRRREHFALVVDEYGVFQGIVTLEDILEEIVGDIADEHDVAVPGVRPQADGSYVIAGSVTLRDLNREFEWNLPDAEATTVAGLIMHEARMLPEAGQTFEFFNFRFRILRRAGNKLASIRVTPPKRIRRMG